MFLHIYLEAHEIIGEVYTKSQYRHCLRTLILESSVLNFHLTSDSSFIILNTLFDFFKMPASS